MKSRYNSNIHHRRSIRLKEYDYSQDGYYFVTICTKNRECFFGDVIDGKMELSPMGGIANECWNDIPKHFSNVLLDVFAIMPNHLHGIIVIDNVGTYHGMSLRQFAKPISKSLSMIINQFKSSVKRQCNKNGFEYFGWQRNYYENVIRNEIALDNIREYIINNLIQWKFDRNNPKNLSTVK
ncbi:MAG: transposase [Candidatus Melainabacteria bacterium]|nr:transposase [Candidatus Melainabacteria bacterium]